MLYGKLQNLVRVDQGGGGTIALLLAKYGAEVLDAGPATLSMHSPYEVTSKNRCL